ncbi:MAG: GSCFA domain-containing protein [Bacteroidales bacterium]
MKFRTEIDIKKAPYPIGYEKPVVMLGSCFTDNTGSYLEKYLFHVSVNPFGVIYNPLSISNSITALIGKEEYLEEELRFHDGLWFSFDHYTKFSDPDRKIATEKINKAFLEAKQLFQRAGHLILTFGSAYVYERKETGKIVNNCHKLPASQFIRRLLTVKEIVQHYQALVDQILSIYPEIKIILTVSPVRHIKDGLTGNQQSKSTLLLSAGELEKLYPDTCYYFPSYEIMMDDLRGYRFYSADLLHPNGQAIEYIWNHFLGNCIKEDAEKIIKSLDPLMKALHHRPLHAHTEQYKKFRELLAEKMRKLKKDFPFLQWSEIDNFLTY